MAPEYLFTADEHYNHANMLLPSHCNRPFIGVDDMTEQMIHRHNLVATKNSKTFHIGDMFWKHTTIAQAKSILSRLNGSHCIVWGNHDEVAKNPEIAKLFEWTAERKIIVIEKQQIVLDHYAGRVWHSSFHKSWQLYGHSHGQLPEDPTLLNFDVGVDCWAYTPVTWEEIKMKMEMKQKTMALLLNTYTDFGGTGEKNERNGNEPSTGHKQKG